MTKSFDLLATVEAALLQGAVRSVVEEQIQRSATAAGAELPDRTEIDACYAEILNRWIADADRDPAELYAYSVRLRKHLFQRSYNLNDFKTCLAIAESLTKLDAKHAEQVRKAEEAKSFADQFKNGATAPVLKSIRGGKK